MTNFKAGFCSILGTHCLVDAADYSRYEAYDSQAELDDAIAIAVGCGHTVERVDSIN